MPKEYRALYEIVNTSGKTTCSKPFKGESCYAILDILSTAKKLSLISGDENGPTGVYVGPIIMRNARGLGTPAQEINIQKEFYDLQNKPNFSVDFRGNRAYVESTLAEQLVFTESKRNQDSQESGLGILLI
jgi:hypothetical protein